MKKCPNDVATHGTRDHRFSIFDARNVNEAATRTPFPTRVTRTESHWKGLSTFLSLSVSRWLHRAHRAECEHTSQRRRPTLGNQRLAEGMFHSGTCFIELAVLLGLSRNSFCNQICALISPSKNVTISSSGVTRKRVRDDAGNRRK